MSGASFFLGGAIVSLGSLRSIGSLGCLRCLGSIGSIGSLGCLGGVRPLRGRGGGWGLGHGRRAPAVNEMCRPPAWRCVGGAGGGRGLARWTLWLTRCAGIRPGAVWAVLVGAGALGWFFLGVGGVKSVNITPTLVWGGSVG